MMDVTVVTRTPAGSFDDSKFPFRVVRQPGLAALLKLVRGTDIVHVVGPAIVPMAVGLLFGKAVAVQHGGYMAVCPIGNYLHLPVERLPRALSERKLSGVLSLPVRGDEPGEKRTESFFDDAAEVAARARGGEYWGERSYREARGVAADGDDLSWD